MELDSINLFPFCCNIDKKKFLKLIKNWILEIENYYRSIFRHSFSIATCTILLFNIPLLNIVYLNNDR